MGNEMTKFLDANQLAERYNGKVSPKTISNWRYSGGGPEYTKIGGRVFYSIDAVEKWEAERKFSPAVHKVE